MPVVNGPDVVVEKEEVGSIDPSSTETFTTKHPNIKPGSWTVYVDNNGVENASVVSVTSKDLNSGQFTLENTSESLSYNVDITYDPEPVTFNQNESREMENTPPNSDVESGFGGGDMPIWSDNRLGRLQALAATTHNNESDYDLSNAVVDTAHAPFNESWQDTEREMEMGEDSINDGSGGGNMATWSDSREGKLNSLVEGTVTNASSFETPNGVVDVNSDPFNERWSDTERQHGISVFAQAFDSDRNKLTGTAYIIAGGSLLREALIDGLTTIASDPPEGTYMGKSLKPSDYTFLFEPDANATDYVEEGIGTRSDITVKYGSLRGKITDSNGNPVSDEPVAFPNVGAEVVTDENGEYELNAGAGDLEFSTLFYTLSGSVTISEFSSVVRDFQFPGVEVEYVLPNGNSIKGANIYAGGLERDSTGDNGKVEFTKMPVATDVEFVLEDIEAKVRTTPQEGGLKTVRFESGAGIQGEVYNEETLSKITDTPIRIVSDASISGKSKGGGRFAVGAFDTGTVRVDVGFNDPRYQTNSIVVELNEGEVVNKDVALSKGFVDSTY